LLVGVIGNPDLNLLFAILVPLQIGIFFPQSPVSGAQLMLLGHLVDLIYIIDVLLPTLQLRVGVIQGVWLAASLWREWDEVVGCVKLNTDDDFVLRRTLRRRLELLKGGVLWGLVVFVDGRAHLVCLFDHNHSALLLQRRNRSTL
jgi:hypothetical protein